MDAIKGPRKRSSAHVHFCCLISSSIKCKRMQPGPPKVLSLGPTGLFRRKVIMLSISHPARTVSVCSMISPHVQYLLHFILGCRGGGRATKRKNEKQLVLRKTIWQRILHVSENIPNDFNDVVRVFQHFTVCFFPRVESL